MGTSEDKEGKRRGSRGGPNTDQAPIMNSASMHETLCICHLFNVLPLQEREHSKLYQVLSPSFCRKESRDSERLMIGTQKVKIDEEIYVSQHDL
jgi:hypothetical protein